MEGVLSLRGCPRALTAAEHQLSAAVLPQGRGAFESNTAALCIAAHPGAKVGVASWNSPTWSGNMPGSAQSVLKDTPMKLREPVAAYNAATNVEAHFVTMLLMEAGIDAMVSED